MHLIPPVVCVTIQNPEKDRDRFLRANENVCIHVLRRPWGNGQATTGASSVIIGTSLNHNDPSVTAIYSRLDLDPVRASVGHATSAMLAAVGLTADAEVVASRSRKEVS
jgi:hypothetical protein